jgi:hypothetical protein
MKAYIYNEGTKAFTFQLNLRSIRYLKRERHPFGARVSFHLTFINPVGKKMRKLFSNIGTDHRAAINNALRTLSVHRD